MASDRVTSAMSGCTLVLVGLVRNTRVLGWQQLQSSNTAPDWLSDSPPGSMSQSYCSGLPSHSSLRGLIFFNERVAAIARRHPLWFTFGVCMIFGVGVGVNQGVREQRLPCGNGCGQPSTCGGHVWSRRCFWTDLGLVRSSEPSYGIRRRVIDALVITCIGILFPFALRYHLWWMVGSTNTVAGLTQLIELLLLFAGAIFAVAFAVETGLRLHPPVVQ